LAVAVAQAQQVKTLTAHKAAIVCLTQLLQQVAVEVQYLKPLVVQVVQVAVVVLALVRLVLVVLVQRHQFKAITVVQVITP
jgi:hypothetical protein